MLNNFSQYTPLVSVIMPIRNEKEFIVNCLEAVLNQDYPDDKIEIIVVDGISNDGTKELIDKIANDVKRLKIYTNKHRIVSTALNIGIKKSRGEIIVRIDGHTIIKSDFISQNIKLLNTNPDAWIVGGPIIHKGKTLFSKALALTMSSSFGVGNANHRKSNYEGFAEGAVFPAIRKFVFEKVGVFDEHFVRNQDDEFNFRVIKSGGKIFISPKVSHSYFVRESPIKLFQQYYQYGFWKLEIIKKHKRTISFRHLVPLFFFLYLIFFINWIVIIQSSYYFQFLLFPLVIYIIFLLLHMLNSMLKTKNIIIGIFSGLSAIIMHISYGLGTLMGIFSKYILNSRLNKTVTELSR
tara:strand:+ start:721 stop:1773 length:1053 start_codon:yes stop_codon:yes gene_type:complete